MKPVILQQKWHISDIDVSKFPGGGKNTFQGLHHGEKGHINNFQQGVDLVKINVRLGKNNPSVSYFGVTLVSHFGVHDSF